MEDMQRVASIWSGRSLSGSTEVRSTSGSQAVRLQSDASEGALGGALSESAQPDKASQWPSTCRYYDSLTMDSECISALLTKDTLYTNVEHPWCLDYTYNKDGKCHHHVTSATDSHAEGVFRKEVTTSSLKLVHLQQNRVYMSGNTVSAISVDRQTWLTLLDQFEVLPSFVELLHNNNGGTLMHTSYGKQSKAEQGHCDSGKPVAEAFHVGYKMGNAVDEETAVYARHDFVTGKTFVLMLGTDPSASQDRVLRLLHARPDASFFHIAFASQSTTFDTLEAKRWELDYATQDFEAETGFTKLKRPGSIPSQKLEQLEWDRNSVLWALEARFMAWGAARAKLNFKALLKHILQFEEACRGPVEFKISTAELQTLRDACEMKAELAQSQYDQTQELGARLNAQLEVIKTLKSQRDTEINIEIAQATRHDSEINVQIATAAQRDSELMRGITFITMLFLPATFVATFFSMVFFHISDGDEQSGRLTKVHQIWWYPAVTVPMTVAVVTWYLARSRKSIWKAVLDFFCRTRSPSEDSEKKGCTDNLQA